MSFTTETVKTAAQNAVYELLRAAVVSVFLWVAQPWLSKKAAAMNVPGAVAWATVVALILVFIGLLLFDSWRVNRSLPRRRVRLLEYHAMHLSWVRDMMVNPNTPTESVDDAGRVVDKHRRLLMDLTPDVFPQSVVAQFTPTTLNIGPANQLVGNLPQAGTRAAVIARVDHLLGRIQSIWSQYGGVQAPRP